MGESNKLIEMRKIMSNLILCKGSMAQTPYHFELTDTDIYTIEELCYYIYNNIYAITEEIFEHSLVEWLKEELQMEEIAQKLENMINNRNNLKDIVVSILCSADYYSEQEILRVIEMIDSMNGLPKALRRKIKADNYLKYGYYPQALCEYESILKSDDAKDISPYAYGLILHNMGIVHLHITSYKAAADCFKNAYAKNSEKQSLIQYLYTLKIDGRDEDFDYELSNYSVSTNVLSEISNNYVFACEEAKQSEEYERVKKIEQLKRNGKLNEYYKQLDSNIEKMKEDYRQKRAVRYND